jgi:hypothetical protein
MMTDHTPADTQGAIELTTEQLLQIKQAAARLQLEFDGVFNAETIERYITDSQTRLGSARINTWLPVLIERFTRDRCRPSPVSTWVRTSDPPCCSCASTTPAGRRWPPGSSVISPATPSTCSAVGPTPAHR